LTYSIRPHEVAKQYGLPLQSVYNLASKHGWRRIKVGRQIHYDVLAVAETLQKD
jgi:hypothetical protein